MGFKLWSFLLLLEYPGMEIFPVEKLLMVNSGSERSIWRVNRIQPSVVWPPVYNSGVRWEDIHRARWWHWGTHWVDRENLRHGEDFISWAHNYLFSGSSVVRSHSGNIWTNTVYIWNIFICFIWDFLFMHFFCSYYM